MFNINYSKQLFNEYDHDEFESLLMEGADPNIQHNNCNTPLHIYTNIDTIKFLLEYFFLIEKIRRIFSNLEDFQKDANPNTENNFGTTPLYCHENIDTIKLLLEYVKKNIKKIILF